MGQKNMCIAYLLWLFGGVLGFHHLYLGRYRHALVWYCTAGGVFGLGWLRDMCRIPDYVDETNQTKQYIEEIKLRMKWNKTPPFETLRFVGELVMGMLFGFLIKVALPEDLMGGHDSPNLKYLDLVVPYAVATGVHLVGNISHQKACFLKCLTGAYLTLPFLMMNSSNVSYTVLASALASNWFGKTWRPLRSKQGDGCCRTVFKLLIFLFCCSLYTTAWLSAIYHNAYVTTMDNEKIKLKDALNNFFTSPAWEEMKGTGEKIRYKFGQEGFGGAWDEFIVSIDPEGETHAYRVLNLGSNASEQEVSAAYRRLVKEWHPDKHKDPEMKKVAEEKFMEIQKAYETLSSIKARRAEKNKQQRGPPDRRKTEL